MVLLPLTASAAATNHYLDTEISAVISNRAAAILVTISALILESIQGLKTGIEADIHKLETKIDNLENNTTACMDKLETRMTDSIKELKTAVLLLQLPGWLLLLSSWFYFH